METTISETLGSGLLEQLIEQAHLELKFGVVLVLVSYLPLIAYIYARSRREQRSREINRVFELLNIKLEHGKIYTYEFSNLHLTIAVLFATLVSLLGLSWLFLGFELQLANTPSFPLGGVLVTQGILEAGSSATGAVSLEFLQAYQQRAQLAFGMAFLGAYLWGLQNLSRRFAMNDLNPGAFFNLAIRMIFAAIVALLLYHATYLMVDNGGSGAETSGAMIALPAFSFFIGMFPQRGVKWMTERMNLFAKGDSATVRPLPLEMVEGLEEYDVFRLNEVGIDSCYDLAAAEFIPLLLRTPYQPRELIDWILQAKLCVRVGEDIAVLRRFGYRNIISMQELDSEAMEELARESSLALSTLRQACKLQPADQDLGRLIAVGQLLGTYWNGAAGETAVGKESPPTPSDTTAPTDPSPVMLASEGGELSVLKKV